MSFTPFRPFILVCLTLAAMASFAQTASRHAKTSDTNPGKGKDVSISCSLAVDPGRPFSEREQSYRECVHDHKSAEYDAEMEKTIRTQKTYEEVVADANKKDIPLSQRSRWIQNELASRGIK